MKTTFKKIAAFLPGSEITPIGDIRIAGFSEDYRIRQRSENRLVLYVVLEISSPTQTCIDTKGMTPEEIAEAIQKAIIHCENHGIFEEDIEEPIEEPDEEEKQPIGVAIGIVSLMVFALVFSFFMSTDGVESVERSGNTRVSGTLPPTNQPQRMPVTTGGKLPIVHGNGWHLNSEGTSPIKTLFVSNFVVFQELGNNAARNPASQRNSAISEHFTGFFFFMFSFPFL